ncbi:MAG: Fic family protein [Bacteroidota bacterium]|nr:Fic family protein [Bacteroidota bacterium]
MKLKIISSTLLPEYLKSISPGLDEAFEALHDAVLSTGTFSFYTSSASVYSSKIEGENIELDSFIKHKRDGIPLLPDYTKKIDDLYNAYIFAKSHELKEVAVSEAHKLLSKNIVAKSYQGKYRNRNMYVSSEDGRIEYVAASPYEVPAEMKKFYEDLEQLLNAEMDIEEVFFYAAMTHLVFVKIHPWNDGNGRSARLLEKWFLAQKLGSKAWFIESEKYYYKHHQTYYNNLRKAGLEYIELDYSASLPFLMMLPAAVLKPLD